MDHQIGTVSEYGGLANPHPCVLATSSAAARARELSKSIARYFDAGEAYPRK
jgi:hypothetical protein